MDNKVMRRTILLFLVIIITMITGALVFRTKLVAAGCSWFLARNGFHSINVVVRELDTRHVLIDHLYFSFSPEDQQIDCHLEQANITFEPIRLLQGWINEVAILQVAIHRQISEEKTPPPSPDLPRLIDHLWADWQSLIPLRTLEIDAFHLSGAGIPPALQQPFDLSLTNNGILQLKSSTGKGEKGAGVGLEIKKTSGRLVLNLKVDGVGEARMALIEEEHKFITNFAVELKKIYPLLNQFGMPDIPPLSQIKSGHLAGTISGDLSQLPPESLTVKAHLDKFSTTDVTAGEAGLYLKLQWMKEENGYFLHPGSLIELTAVHIPGLSLQQGNFELAGIIGREEAGINFQLDGASSWQLNQLRGKDIAAEQLQCTPNISGTISPGVSIVWFAPSFFCTGQKIAAKQLHIPKLTLQAGQENRLEIRENPALTWSLDESDWLLDIPRIKKSDLLLDLQPFSFTIGHLGNTNGYLNIDGRIAVSEVALSKGMDQTAIRDLSAQVFIGKDQIKASGTFSPGEFGQPVAVNIDHVLSTERGTLSLQTQKPLHLSKEHPASSLLAAWPYSFDADGGKLTLKLDAGWAKEKPFTAQAAINLDSVSGKWKELTFSGLSLQHNLEFFPTIASLDSMQLSLDVLNIGVPVTDINARLHLSKDSEGIDVAMEQCAFTLFDSYFTVEPFLYRTADQTSRIRVKLQHLDLAIAVPYQKVKGLEVSGSVDGMLPLEISPDGLRIEDGALWQNGPGTISYRPEDSTAMKRAGLPDFVIKAMEDFQYDSLQTKVSYQPDGQLDLSIQLQGKSPRIDTNRPIHLNLNVEQNLLYLLKSLRYSGLISQEIEKSIQKSMDGPEQVK
ncbi:MAG: YdbH domain-containing protein [Thermodesulfobacteriota bacterium]|nr:YdbH domain-containing protein [Thermodesulfobacteriota bacterium]